MNRLSRKFIIGIILILALSSACSILINGQFIERYYLYQKRADLSGICNEFIELLEQGNSSQLATEQVETFYKVIVAQIENEPAMNSEMINEEIQSAFQEKGIGFQKYWFWEEDYKKVLEGKNQIRLYNQDRLNYSLLVAYIQKGPVLYAITMIVPNISDAFRIANQFLLVVNISTIIVAILFIILLIRRITRPLHLFEEFAEKMKKQQFVPIDVHTGDELESVSDSLNSMGNQIMEYQSTLQKKNIQMEELLDNVAHDLKTPISLVGLYANGIKDDLDDGTFLDTILEENKQMSDMVNRLLYLSRLGKEEYDELEIDLSVMLKDMVREYAVLAGENEMEFHSSIESGIMVSGNTELLKSVFTNLITNAVKYSTGKEISITLFREKSGVTFAITNETKNGALDLEKIWTPYYVGEQSRNKKMSGTGLGLSIVYKICQIYQYSVQCQKEEEQITFRVSIPARP